MGFQLWANLPRFEDDASRLPGSEGAGYSSIKTTRHRKCASSAESSGASEELSTASPRSDLIDVYVPPGNARRCRSEISRQGFAYVFEGAGKFLQCLGATRGADGRRGVADVIRRPKAENRTLVLFYRGDEVQYRRDEQGIRFLLVSASRCESRSRGTGQIVMNTQEQLQKH